MEARLDKDMLKPGALEDFTGIRTQRDAGIIQAKILDNVEHLFI